MSQRGTIQVKTLKKNTKPVISESVLDIDSQRYYIWALFTLIQAWKLYDLYILHNEPEIDGNSSLFPSIFFNILPPKISFIFKYFFFDSLLILMIPFLNIPKLSFTPTISLILLCIMNTLTLLLTCSFSFTLSSVLYSVYRAIIPEKELAIMETYVDTDSIINQSDHFKGKKTIRYAPDSFIKINPYSQQFCINPDNDNDNSIKIPIKVESTYDLNFLQINYHDFSNTDNILNYTKKEIKSFIVNDYYDSPYIKYDPSVLADNNVQILEVPVSRPGFYSIKMATDKKDKFIRSYRSDTIIPVCPEAAFTSEKSLNVDKCVDDTVNDLEITLLGVPPFTLYYEEEINGQLSKLPPTVVSNTENIDSPLNPNDNNNINNNGNNNNNHKYPSKYLKDISWAKSYTIMIPIGEKKLEKSGKYIYTINKIVDGFGNSVSYIPDPNDQSSFRSFISHPKPILSLSDPKPDIPVLIDSDKYIDVQINNLDCKKCESPLNLVYKFVPDELDTDNEEHIFNETFTPSSGFGPAFRIKAEKPGTYILQDGSTKYCPCKIGASSLTIGSAKLPSMNVVLDPIVDNCVGTTGFKFKFDFIGNAPFEIGYKICKLDPTNPERVLRVEKASLIKSDSTSLEYDFKPSSEGSYSIEFLNLNDKFYKNKVKYNHDEHRYITYFKQRPKAYFNKSNKVQKIECCHGTSKSVTLNIEGEAPFFVSYDLIAPDYSIQSYTLEGILENTIQIDTPVFNKGGEYILALKIVKDSTNCDVDFRGQEIHIDVRHDTPQLSFQTEETYEIVKGKKFYAPLAAPSNDLIDLIYSYQSFDGKTNKEISLRNFNPVLGFELYDEGIYKLVSFKQGGCNGIITNDYSITIKYISFPTLQIVNTDKKSLIKKTDTNFQKPDICQNQNDQINLKANGSAPFIVLYDVKHPDGKIEQRVEQINNNFFTLQMTSHIKGAYTYTIKNIYDSVYTEDIIDQLKTKSDYEFEKLIFTQDVTALPLAKFMSNYIKYQICISSLDDLSQVDPIFVELQGSFPISLKLDIYHEHEGILESVEFNGLTEAKSNLNSIYDYLSVGNHIVSITEIIDKNGCIFDEKDESIVIQVNDVPKIRHLAEESNQLSESGLVKDFNYYCVGDQITYMLNGVSPFKINYEFNSVSQEVEVQGNYFKRLAPGPGQLDIKSLADSSAKGCEVDFTEMNRNDLKAVIYDLPSVEIVQGDSIEEDIQEGEQIEIIFLLTGTPPFKLTYIRKELDDSSKIVETEIVEDIRENEYRIMANLEGTYEAIEIQDRYCVARNHRI